jgi:hypothetical protein
MSKLIWICSPYRAREDNTIADNEKLLDALNVAVMHAGHYPWAPHGYYTRFLNDADPFERQVGLTAGRAWMLRSDAVWVYVKLGLSVGMYGDIEFAQANNIPVVHDPLPFQTVSPRAR